MKFENPYWSIQTKLDLLARWLIVHSIVYYVLNDSVVDDSMWDSNARQYVWLARSNPGKAKQTRWGYIMEGFDGTTGFHLHSKLKKKDRLKLTHEAERLVFNHGSKAPSK